MPAKRPHDPWKSRLMWWVGGVCWLAVAKRLATKHAASTLRITEASKYTFYYMCAVMIV